MEVGGGGLDGVVRWFSLLVFFFSNLNFHVGEYMSIFFGHTQIKKIPSHTKKKIEYKSENPVLHVIKKSNLEKTINYTSKYSAK
jgi:hypothetical protein